MKSALQQIFNENFTGKKEQAVNPINIKRETVIYSKPRQVQKSLKIWKGNICCCTFELKKGRECHNKKRYKLFWFRDGKKIYSIKKGIFSLKK